MMVTPPMSLPPMTQLGCYFSSPTIPHLLVNYNLL